MREHFSQAKLNKIQEEIKELSTKIPVKEALYQSAKSDYRLLEQDYVVKEKDLLRNIPSDDPTERKKHIDNFYQRKQADLRKAVEKMHAAEYEYQSLQQQLISLQKIESEEGAKLMPTYDEYANPVQTVPLTNRPTWTRANQAMTRKFTTDFNKLGKKAEDLRAEIKSDNNQIEYRLANHQTARLDLNTNSIYLSDLSDGSLRDSALLFKASGMDSIDISNFQGKTKANMWLASRLANLNVTGYTPTSADEDRLSSQQRPLSSPLRPHP